MISADRMREFVEIVNAGSISSAAERLGIPRATLSRRLSALEADLSVRLLHRRTNRLTLTEAGRTLHQKAVAIQRDIEETWSMVRRSDDVPRGLLRVSIADTALSEIFASFAKQYPEVDLEVRATTQHEDMLSEGIDVAVRAGTISDPNLIARQMMQDRLCVVASPAYLATHGTPKSIKDLSAHNCIVGFAGGWTAGKSWPLRRGGSVAVSGRFKSNSLALSRTAVLQGVGLALLPLHFTDGDIEEGTLVPLLEDQVGTDVSISVVYVDREFIEPKVRALVDAILAHFKDLEGARN
ncbi:transcriptional regulator [Pseudovibrio japonicus]|uniref:Transcriptional regulator n=1 Tax=Pseudovibrio japonicus TaxID=366534 RepID=A0ABQ3EJB5_9HYPH|nr:LysR family transcriptional regulator [Pseudovibrio japonicus]GHB42505.1 transcriptional regulator [Pseudovibrio japonicus]